ncbi:MAG: glycosyltransferase family 4 protein [Chloroflexi bacterium]|nr:glycosyltransferase family 4 protein [Chloroflexota bacterium]
MRILFVAIPDSVHTVRWISQLVNQRYDLHLFPSTWGGPHPALNNVKLHLAGIGPRSIAKIAYVVSKDAKWEQRLHSVLTVFDRSFWLTQVILMVKPDIIHSLEIQHAGYQTLAARERLGGKFPTWIVTNWGSDVYLFGRLTEHVDRIKAVLAACDYYSCECQRDVQLAKDMGLRGEVLPVLPNTGGFDLEWVRQFRQPGPTSARSLVVLKGYQGWAGRALVGLRAIELSADVLKGYRVAVYLAGHDVRIAAELVAQSTGIPIEIIPYCPHEDMLRLHGRARVSIGLSISDAVSTSLLEAMMMGSFPIQSNTGCADEWIRCGETGLLVHPEDSEAVAAAIRRAVTDDALVDRAAGINAQVAAERLDQSVIQPQVIAMYEKVAARGKRQSTQQ